jgi:hypothetical protein
MKTLREILLESIGRMNSIDYTKVWKGKKVNLSNNSGEDFEYIMNGILTAHQGELPTAEEFENVCDFVLDNFKNLPISEIEDKFLHKFVETFFPKAKMYKFSMMHNIVFYGHKFANRDNDHKIIYGKQLQEIADAWGLDAKDFPDYSNAVEKMSKKLKK